MKINTHQNSTRMENSSRLCGKVWIDESLGKETLIVEIQPRKNSRPECLVCGRRRVVYDVREIRKYEYVPL